MGVMAGHLFQLLHFSLCSVGKEWPTSCSHCHGLPFAFSITSIALGRRDVLGGCLGLCHLRLSQLRRSYGREVVM